MGNDLFTVDLRDLRRLIKFYENAPGQFARAAAGVLNHHAFESRKYQIAEIEKTMTVRNRRFVSGRIRAEKARPSRDINNLVSRSGSLRGPRFSGWEEQQTGRKTQRKRTQTKAARGGDWKSQVKTVYRMKSSGRFFKPEQFAGRNQKAKFMFMMRVMATRGGGVFQSSTPITTKRGQMKRGVYLFRNHQVTRLQTFDPQNPQPRRNPWHSEAIDKYRQKVNLRNIWVREIQRVLKI